MSRCRVIDAGRDGAAVRTEACIRADAPALCGGLRFLTKRHGGVYIPPPYWVKSSSNGVNVMVAKKSAGWVRPVARMLCVALAAISLAGCVVVPFRPYHAPRYYYY